MSKTRFIVSVILTLGLTLWGIIFGGNPLLLFLDSPSLVFVPIFPYIVTSFIYSPKEQRVFSREIFKPAGEGDKKELERAISFLDTLKNLTIVFAILATFIGFIGILGNLSQMSDITIFGRNFGVLSICVFYGIVFIAVVIEPLKGAAKKNLIG